jgi:hypothetical protein
MNIFALIAILSLNCFADKAKQTKMPPVPAVTMALNEYSPLAPLFLRAVKGHLPRSGEVPLVVHALPQVVVPAKCSFFRKKLQRVQIKKNTNDRPVKINPKHVITSVSRDG